MNPLQDLIWKKYKGDVGKVSFEITELFCEAEEIPGSIVGQYDLYKSFEDAIKESMSPLQNYSLISNFTKAKKREFYRYVVKHWETDGPEKIAKDWDLVHSQVVQAVATRLRRAGIPLSHKNNPTEYSPVLEKWFAEELKNDYKKETK